MAVCWVALEYVRNWLLTGFPWGNIGYSQIDCLWVVQSADLFGVYGLVAMLVAVNALIADVIRRSMAGHAWPWPQCGCRRSAAARPTGLWPLAGGQDWTRTGGRFGSGWCRGSIDQAVKWNPTHLQHTLDRYLQLSNQAQDPDLLVWPESATPFFLPERRYAGLPGAFRATRSTRVSAVRQPELCTDSRLVTRWPTLTAPTCSLTQAQLFGAQ